MMNIREEKQQLRKQISHLKKEYSSAELYSFSIQALNRLEQMEIFRNTTHIAIYHAIPGEVQTAFFIEKWRRDKQFYLPVIAGDDLQLVPYRNEESLHAGLYGIMEPAHCPAGNWEKEIQLILIPGIAFDRHYNRMGRGKGYYDRLLSQLKATQIGLCYHFQLFDTIPTEPFDKKMDMIISDKEYF